MAKFVSNNVWGLDDGGLSIQKSDRKNDNLNGPPSFNINFQIYFLRIAIILELDTKSLFSFRTLNECKK